MDARLTVIIALVAALPLANAQEGAPVHDDFEGPVPVGPIGLASTTCGGTAPSVKLCVQDFVLPATGVTVTLSGCYTGDLTVTITNTNPLQVLKGTLTRVYALVCGHSLGTPQETGIVYAGAVEAKAETRTLYNFLGQDKGLGPWSVTYTY